MTTQGNYDIRLLKKSLISAQKSDGRAELLDILIALASTTVTPDTIKELKLGKIMMSVRETYSDSDPTIAAKAKDIMLAWKSIISSGELSSQPTKHHPPESAVDAAIVAPPVMTHDHCWHGTSFMEAITPQRQRIVDNFIELFGSFQSTKTISKVISYCLEDEIYKAYPSETKSRDYISKCKTLIFNIRSNEQLREQVASRDIPLSKLIYMTPNELARKEVVIERTKINEEVIDSKRSDWLDAHRLDIQASLDIDPENTWDYDEDDGSGSDGPDEAD